jgi:hypothetical protein
VGVEDILLDRLIILELRCVPHREPRLGDWLVRAQRLVVSTCDAAGGGVRFPAIDSLLLFLVTRPGIARNSWSTDSASSERPSGEQGFRAKGGCLTRNFYQKVVDRPRSLPEARPPTLVFVWGMVPQQGDTA